ncbi:MAG TPA: hypothetical protein VLD62_00090, partial [Acidimicrobiia bacterium]|nr:hypothetical protein [Acidimicrobiia bacterium]
MSDLREKHELHEEARPPVVHEVQPPTVIEPRPPRGWIGWVAALVAAGLVAAGVTWLIVRGGGEEPVAQPSIAEPGLDWHPALGPLPGIAPVVPAVGEWDPSFGSLPGVAPVVPAVGEWDPSFGPLPGVAPV